MHEVGPVVIFGGRGQIGAAVVAGLISEGYSVASIDEHPPSQADGSSYGHGAALEITADVRQKPELKEALEIVKSEVGIPSAIAYFIHYKGPRELRPGADFFSSFEDYPLDEWDQALQTNLTGLMLACQVFGAEMVRAGTGSIVTVSSTYGLVGPDQTLYGDSGINSPVPYATTKAGVIGFTRYLAAYWGRHGVRSNCLVPGGVENQNQSKSFRENYISRTTLGRMAQPADYVGPTRFLVSKESSYMNGSVMVVDGGWTAI